MLLAVIACILGIVLENMKWPQDRSAAKEHFLEAEGPAKQTLLLVGLVLNHSVVRWLISFAVAAILVRVLLEVPALREAIRAAVETGALGIASVDAIIGLAISALMVLLSIAARWIARGT